MLLHFCSFKLNYFYFLHYLLLPFAIFFFGYLFMHVTYHTLTYLPSSISSESASLFICWFHFLGLLSSFSLRFLRTAGAILMGIYNFSPKSELFLLLSDSVVSCIKWNCIAFSPIFCVCCFMAGHRTTASAVGHQWRALRKSTIL